MTPLRLLQVGVGAHGRTWALDVINKVPEFVIAGYVDSDGHALDALRSENNTPDEICFQSLDTAIRAVQPDAVLNATPFAAHVPITQEALRAGLHVLVEKPFAPSLDAANQLVDLAEANGLVLMVNQNLRFYSAPRAIATLVRNAPLGALYEVAIDFRRDLLTGPAPLQRRLVEERQLLVDMAVHHFDLLRQILGREATRVCCEAQNPPWSAFGGPSSAVAAIMFDGDVIVGYRGSLVSPGPPTPWAGEWRLQFEKGEVSWTGREDNPDEDQVLVRPRSPGDKALGVTLPLVPRTGLSGSLTEFATAIRTGRDSEISGRNNLGTVALMLAAVDSATRHRPLTIHKAREGFQIS